ncbi:protein ORF116 [Lake sturgeon herpesvirus]|nr:protein ORF116 [Lake sturgeon herpesvirus]
MLSHVKVIDHLELSLLQRQTAYVPLIEVQTLSLDALSFYIHQFIFDDYLSSSQHPLSQQQPTIKLKTSHLTALIFVTCLYLHRHKLLKRYSLQAKHADLIPLARLYNLQWLESFYWDCLTVEGSRVYGPICQLKNELVVVGADRLLSTQCPPHARAFTISPNGRDWYALCSPHPYTVQLWVKTSRAWRQLTSLSDRWCEKTEFQLALANDGCLYVLSDETRLECYHQVKREWHQVPLTAENGVTYVLAQQGDGTLPITLLVNNEAREILNVTYDHHISDFEIRSICPKPSAISVNYKPPHVLKRYLDSVAQTNLSAERLGYVLKDLKHNIRQEAQRIKEINTPSSLRDRWNKALVVRRVIYARRDDSWSTYKNDRWASFNTRGDEEAEPFWNPHSQKLSTVLLDNDPASPYLKLDKLEGNRLDWFNPNVSYLEPLKGLEELKHTRAYKNPANDGDNVTLISELEVSPPLRLFLDHLCLDLAEKLNTDLTLGTNGGLRHLPDGKHVELYTLNPPLTHRTSLLSLTDFADRFTRHSATAILVGSGFLEVDSQREGVKNNRVERDVDNGKKEEDVGYFMYQSAQDKKAILI